MIKYKFWVNSSIFIKYLITILIYSSCSIFFLNVIIFFTKYLEKKSYNTNQFISIISLHNYVLLLEFCFLFHSSENAFFFNLVLFLYFFSIFFGISYLYLPLILNEVSLYNRNQNAIKIIGEIFAYSFCIFHVYYLNSGKIVTSTWLLTSISSLNLKNNFFSEIINLTLFRIVHLLSISVCLILLLNYIFSNLFGLSSLTFVRNIYFIFLILEFFRLLVDQLKNRIFTERFKFPFFIYKDNIIDFREIALRNVTQNPKTQYLEYLALNDLFNVSFKSPKTRNFIYKYKWKFYKKIHQSNLEKLKRIFLCFIEKKKKSKTIFFSLFFKFKLDIKPFIWSLRSFSYLLIFLSLEEKKKIILSEFNIILNEMFEVLLLLDRIIIDINYNYQEIFQLIFCMEECLIRIILKFRSYVNVIMIRSKYINRLNILI